MGDLDTRDGDLETNESMNCSEQVVQICDTIKPDVMQAGRDASRT